MTSSEPVLISPAELAELLGSVQPPVVADVRWTLGGPPGKPDPGSRAAVLRRREQTRFSSASDDEVGGFRARSARSAAEQSNFEASHIPGAVWVDLETQLAGPPGVGGRHPLPTVAVFERAMRDIGVCQDSMVVAYDAATSQAASRLWWLLTDAGHWDVRVLNGGLAAWRAAGLPTASGPGSPPPRGDFVAHPGHRPRLSAAEISARLGTPDAPTLVDVRAAERYSGDSEPIDPVAGHIPGAINLPATANLRPDGRFLPPAEIARLYVEAGGSEGAVLYCGSGITAAHSLLALESAGLTAAIYPGSWSDWIRGSNRPVATGTDP